MASSAEARCPSRWLVPACDTLSFAYLAPVVVGGGGVMALALLLLAATIGIFFAVRRFVKDVTDLFRPRDPSA